MYDNTWINASADPGPDYVTSGAVPINPREPAGLFSVSPETLRTDIADILMEMRQSGPQSSAR